MTPPPQRGAAERCVLVTHADEPIGRRIVKTLYHDDRVRRIVAVGSGRPPRSFDRFLGGSGDRLSYARVDLARHRPTADLFHSNLVRRSGVDSVIHVPRHAQGAAGAAPLLAGVSERTAEARLVLQHCLELREVRSLVALGSAFVYRLAPGNANRFTEQSELDLDPALPAEIRAWIDCDMIFHGELHNQSLRVMLLRIPTVVASGGYVFMNPALAGRALPRMRPLGFDPLTSIVSDKDVARAVRLALHAEGPGVLNIAGREAIPLSTLARWTGRGCVPLPGSLLRGGSRTARMLGVSSLQSAMDGAHLRYGFTLDTRRAQQEIGYRPGYRIGLSRAGDGALRIETAPA